MAQEKRKYHVRLQTEEFGNKWKTVNHEIYASNANGAKRMATEWAREIEFAFWGNGKWESTLEFGDFQFIKQITDHVGNIKRLLIRELYIIT